jgi:hypothetical protein
VAHEPPPLSAARPARPPNSRAIRTAFFGAWAVVGVVFVAVLVLNPSGFGPLGPTDQASYVGSQVPTGTNFTFLFSETVALYVVNVSSLAPGVPVRVDLFGNWSASSPTAVSVEVNGVSAKCPYPWGCFGTPGNLSGAILANVTVTSETGSSLGVRQATISVVFWAAGSDTVTATSPIYARAGDAPMGARGALTTGESALYLPEACASR